MKAILEFDLPEEHEEFNLAVKAGDYYSALFDIYNELRSEYKYGKHSVVRLDRMYDMFFEILDDYEVNI